MALQSSQFPSPHLTTGTGGHVTEQSGHPTVARSEVHSSVFVDQHGSLAPVIEVSVVTCAKSMRAWASDHVP
jgi:hypothetical protein